MRGIVAEEEKNISKWYYKLFRMFIRESIDDDEIDYDPIDF